MSINWTGFALVRGEVGRAALLWPYPAPHSPFSLQIFNSWSSHDSHRSQEPSTTYSAGNLKKRSGGKEYSCILQPSLYLPSRDCHVAFQQLSRTMMSLFIKAAHLKHTYNKSPQAGKEAPALLKLGFCSFTKQMETYQTCTWSVCFSFEND